MSLQLFPVPKDEMPFDTEQLLSETVMHGIMERKKKKKKLNCCTNVESKVLKCDN